MADTPPDAVTQWLGVKLSLLIAGISGAIVRLTIVHPKNPWEGVGVIVAGGASAVFLAPVAIEFFSVIPRTETALLALGYTFGLTGMLICEGLLVLARRWRSNPALPKR